MKKNETSKPLSIEAFNIKFPTFDNPGLFNEPKLECTKEELILSIIHCKDSLSAFLTKFDGLFDLYSSEIANPLKEHFDNNKLYLLNLRIGFSFFLRKLQMISMLFKGEDIRQYLSANKTSFITQFITEHSGSVLINDPEKLKEIIVEHFVYEAEIINHILGLPETFSPSITAFNATLKFIMGVLSTLTLVLPNFEGIKSLDKLSEETIMKFLNLLHQLDICGQLIQNYYYISGSSIWDAEETSNEWVKIKEHFQRIVIYPKDDVKAMLKKITDVVNLGYAAVSKGYGENSNSLAKKASTGFYMAYYFFNKKKAQTQSYKFLINPDSVVSQTIWNMMDAKGFKQAIKIILPHIAYSKKWWVKRVSNEMTLNDVINLTNQIKQKDFVIDNVKAIKEKLRIKLDKGPLRDEEISELIQEKVKKEEKKKGYIKVKLLHNENIRIPTRNPISNFVNTCCSPNIINNRDSIIMHVHGGGFVAMSPSSHENYTRKWVNGLSVPLISVDYSLSPQFPFPKALDEIYQVYLWLITYGEDVLKMSIKNIILVGDSAGGNLVLSLAFLIIAKGVRLPSAVFMAYPALKLSMKELSLSYLNSLTDPILEYSLLKFCLVSYSGNCDEYNPFLSPLFMDEKIMKHLPPVRIFGGTSDPLRDDSILLMKKLISLGVDAQMKEIKYFPHGYLNYDIPIMMPEAGIANELIINEMEKFIVEN